uniref:CUE domain-containing protein n=1 Tax=Fagus sylvatica TaxID=28930 RepID=A0A2N9GYU0_FAGSY
MSAIVCGKRSSIFEDNHNLGVNLAANPPVSKRIRCSSSSPVRFSHPTPTPTLPSFASSDLIQHLRAIFPHMDHKLLERALEECGNDIDSAIRSLNELRLGSTDNNLGSAAATSDVTLEANDQSQGVVTDNGEVPAGEELSAPQNPPMDGADWVELFVREMMSASNVDDARTRASRVLEVLERSICARASAEATQSFHQVFSSSLIFFIFSLVDGRNGKRSAGGARAVSSGENMMLKEQVEALIQENTILKRAVSIQHERQKEYEERNQELQHLKQLVSQYQDQLRTLEVNNYALTMHLKQSQQSNSIPGRFHPDVF